ncbi:MAG: SAM-dependent methyltransferase [Sulfurospirillaceae bacterium]|nr:SAM-dependent methyltransferase [Sulfurospirillaceae bacterium]
MKFSTYMQEWLYGEEGYYKKHLEIGKKGDFYTAVSTSMFFGGCIAKRLIDTIKEGFLSKDSFVVEIGAHKGYLLADMIQFIYTLEPELLKTLRFVIVEPFVENKKMQKEYFQDSFNGEIELLHVNSLEELRCESAFFVANEIFDAFSCEVINDKQMLHVEGKKLVFKEANRDILDMASSYGIKKGEVAIGYEDFAKTMKNASKRCEFVTFDYGDKDSRGDFSIRVYDKHNVYPFFALSDFVEEESLREKGNFYDYFGRCDITYDVNFSHLAGAFKGVGFKEHLYLTQMSALVEFGLSELLEILNEKAPKELYLQELNKARVLIDPSFMGERFKMISFRK